MPVTIDFSNVCINRGQIVSTQARERLVCANNPLTEQKNFKKFVLQFTTATKGPGIALSNKALYNAYAKGTIKTSKTYASQSINNIGTTNPNTQNFLQIGNSLFPLC